jgi:hypothetical protein
MAQSCCFHRLVLGKSTNPNFSCILFDLWRFKPNPSNFFRYLVGFLTTSKQKGSLLVGNHPNPSFLFKCSKLVILVSNPKIFLWVGIFSY